jgi:peptide/nickel transport system substrate-binding protein
MKRIALTLIIALLALPAVAMAKADLVVVTDAPPKSMNPHAFSSDANLSYMSNFFDGCCNVPRRTAYCHPRWPKVGSGWMA